MIGVNRFYSGMLSHISDYGRYVRGARHGEVYKRPAGPIIPGKDVIQNFVASADYFSSISILMATYKRRPSCSIVFSLFKMSGQHMDPATAVFVLRETADAIKDNEYFDLFFTPDARSKGEVYSLRISSDDARRDNCVTVWLHNGLDRLAGHATCHVGLSAQQEFGMVARVGYSPPTPYTPLPERLLFSPVTQCNLNCTHCISRDTRNSASRLSDEIRSQISVWCSRGDIKSIATDYSGDVLWADHRWGGELDFLVGLGVPFHVDTNGVYLDEARSRKLFASKMEWLNVSLDASAPETYKRVRKGSAPLDVVIGNVERAARVRDEICPKSGKILSLGFTLMRSNLDQLNDFISIGRRIGVDLIACRHIEAYTPDMESESLLFDKERFNEARLSAIQHAERLGITLAIDGPLDDRATRPGHRFCLVPWMSTVILGNGDVQVCCLPKTKIGNLGEQTMEEIWSGDAYARFRLAVNSDTSPGCCNACAYSRRPGNVQSYLPHRTINQWIEPIRWKGIDS